MYRILVALDAPPRAPVVLAAAADLAQRTGAEMSLLRAVGIPPGMEKLTSIERGTDLIGTLTTNANLELEALAKNLPDRSIEVDRIIGTTAANVVNHCDCSVFVVRPAAGKSK